MVVKWLIYQNFHKRDSENIVKKTFKIRTMQILYTAFCSNFWHYYQYLVAVLDNLSWITITFSWMDRLVFYFEYTGILLKKMNHDLQDAVGSWTTIAEFASFVAEHCFCHLWSVSAIFVTAPRWLEQQSV